ncbi:hypothetical protein SLA2020_378990 [Shorea laevis]
MKGLKSPGPDGIQAIFYQRHWETVKGTFVDFVNNALALGSFDSDLAKALVVLIPKEDNPNQLIGPYQSSFLAGRSMTNNIVLTQEVVHSMQRMKGSNGAMLLKIDLHKAFDSVD